MNEGWPGGPRREDLYEPDDAFPTHRRHPVATTGSVVLGTLGALAAGLWALGDSAVQALGDHPELAGAIGAMAGAPWLAPALIGAAALLHRATKGVR